MATPRKKVRRSPIASVSEPARRVKTVMAGAQTLFTTTQFTQLQYVAGANGTSDDIVVTAQTLAGVASEAIQITNTVSGTRSVNYAVISRIFWAITTNAMVNTAWPNCLRRRRVPPSRPVRAPRGWWR